jgi:hypothetical protein
MSRPELKAALDFILNEASDSELDVVVKACERRIRDRTVFASLGGQGPAAMARDMAEGLAEDVGATMERVRGTVRGFVADIVRKQAPEIGEDQLAALLDEYAPEPGSARERPAPPALPPEAVLGMLRSFVAYSEGRMAPSRQRELWESDPDWQSSYWKSFSPELKALVKAYLEGRVDGDTFGTAVLSILGL